MLYLLTFAITRYAENTPRSGGHDMHKFKAAEKEMIKTAKLIDEITESNLRKQGLKILMNDPDDSNTNQAAGSVGGKGDIELGSMGGNGNNNNNNNKGGGGGGGDSERGHYLPAVTDIYTNIDANAVVAFVTFEYNESFARCVSDYGKYSSFPFSMLAPDELKFHGHTIHVETAPEPDQIVWENLELPKRKKFWLRQRTLVVAVALVVIAFIVILQSSIAQKVFSSSIPDLTFCHSTVPNLYLNGTSGISVTSMELTRPKKADLKQLDKDCQALVSHTFYGEFTVGGTPGSDVVGTYDINMCTADTAESELGSLQGGLCPRRNSPSFCPCHSTVDKQNCETYECQKNGDGCGGKDSFEAGAIGSCYCYDALREALRSYGVVGSLDSLQGIEQGICKDFFKQYSTAVGLSYVSVGITVGVNVLLRFLLVRLAKQEGHSYTDLLEGSIMEKVFVSNYIVSSLLILVAYGQVNNLPAILKDLHVLTGPYSDFSVEWYADIGFYFITTFIIQSFSPLAMVLLNYFIILPTKKFYYNTQIRYRYSTRLDSFVVFCLAMRNVCL